MAAPLIVLLGMPRRDVEAVEAMLDDDGDPPLLVVAATAGEAAALIADLAHARAATPRLIAIDARLGDTVRTLVARVRGAVRLAEVPVVVIGAQPAAGDLRCANAVSLLPRPTSYAAFQRLSAVIRAALADVAQE